MDHQEMHYGPPGDVLWTTGRCILEHLEMYYGPPGDYYNIFLELFFQCPPTVLIICCPLVNVIFCCVFYFCYS